MTCPKCGYEFTPEPIPEPILEAMKRNPNLVALVEKYKNQPIPEPIPNPSSCGPFRTTTFEERR